MNIIEVQRSNGVTRRNLVVEWCDGMFNTSPFNTAAILFTKRHYLFSIIIQNFQNKHISRFAKNINHIFTRNN